MRVYRAMSMFFLHLLQFKVPVLLDIVVQMSDNFAFNGRVVRAGRSPDGFRPTGRS